MPDMSKSPRKIENTASNHCSAIIIINNRSVYLKQNEIIFINLSKAKPDVFIFCYCSLWNLL